MKHASRFSLGASKANRSRKAAFRPWPRLLRPALLMLLGLLAACSAPGMTAPQAEALAHSKGCDLDLKRICQDFVDRPQFALNNEQFDLRRLQANARRHD